MPDEKKGDEKKPVNQTGQVNIDWGDTSVDAGKTGRDKKCKDGKKRNKK